MTPEAPVRFLVALGQALSSSRLYAPEHPARERAARDVFDRARELLRQRNPAVFTFLEGEAALGDRRVEELRDWPWTEELASAGVERLELTAGLTPEEVEDLVERLSGVLAGEGGTADAMARARWPHVRFGRLATHDEILRVRAGMEDHLDELSELFVQAREEGVVAVSVSETIVDTITEAIRQVGDLLTLLVPLKEMDQYSTVHSMNVSVLSVGFAEQQGFDGSDVRTVGESALLHDLGKCLVPEEVLQKPGPLTDDEWELIHQHPADGARILIRSRDGLLLPAVVAYEHHMYLDGSGYPPRRYERAPHPVSQLIQICDVFDALRTRRPFRDAWPMDQILAYLDEAAGTRFHPDAVRSFLDLLRRWEGEGDEEEAEAQGGQPDLAGTGKEAAMTQIHVEPAGGDDYRVRIQEGGGSSRHTVTVTDAERERYAPGSDPEALVRASIRFLLEREPKESILPTFSLSTIEGYFPEYADEIGGRVG